MFGNGASFRPMNQVRLAQGPAPVAPVAPPVAPVAPVAPVGPVVIPVAPAPAPVIITEAPAPSNMTPLLIVAAIAAGIAAVVAISRD